MAYENLMQSVISKHQEQGVEIASIKGEIEALKDDVTELKDSMRNIPTTLIQIKTTLDNFVSRNVKMSDRVETLQKGYWALVGGFGILSSVLGMLFVAVKIFD